jgi:acyl-CoA reductase-like NAD-dependent aldehyde dehydrogenase
LDEKSSRDETRGAGRGAHTPFGGLKNRGFGGEGGRFPMEEMTALKWIAIQSGQRAFPI